MFFLILGGALFIGGSALVVWIVQKKFATLCVVDPSTARNTQEKILRERLLEDRMRRALSVHTGRVAQVFAFPWKMIQTAFRKGAGRLLAIERHYHREHTKRASLSPDELQAILHDAERAFREDKLQKAEERLVETISASPKFAPAYELLGRVYRARKEWKEASESLEYFVKLVSHAHEGWFMLGEVYEDMHHNEKALAAYARALQEAPSNPKYLDAVIDTGIRVGDAVQARRALAVLAEVNPENKKIAEYRARLDDKKEDPAPVQKTRTSSKKTK